jgi:ADP-ribose pyrophosphatase YjhB (NUDIX family)
MTGRGEPRWLSIARELQALGQTGLAFSLSQYDTQRYRRLMEIAAEVTASYADFGREAALENFVAQPGYATPKVDVRGAVVRENCVLLVQEKSDGCWCMPGGWADVGEGPSAMVIREVLEESGLDVKPVRLVGVYDANRGGRPLELYHAYKLVFLCDILGGAPRAGDETLAAQFHPFDRLPDLSSNRTSSRHLADVKAVINNPSLAVVFD